MADNTLLNNGAGGDTVRSVQRGAVGPKTQVTALDVGGPSAELLASYDNPVPVSFAARVLQMLTALVNPLWVDPASSRMRVVLDPQGGAQTLATVTTVGTVSTVTTVGNQTQVGGLAANGLVHDQMHATWAASVRRAVS